MPIKAAACLPAVTHSTLHFFIFHPYYDHVCALLYVHRASGEQVLQRMELCHRPAQCTGPLEPVQMEVNNPEQEHKHWMQAMF